MVRSWSSRWSPFIHTLVNWIMGSTNRASTVGQVDELLSVTHLLIRGWIYMQIFLHLPKNSIQATDHEQQIRLISRQTSDRESIKQLSVSSLPKKNNKEKPKMTKHF